MNPDGALTVRAAVLYELDAVLDLWAGSRSVAAVTPDTLDGVRRLLETDAESLLVVELEGRIVGAAIAAWDGWRGTIYRLAVAPEFRRRGIGTALADTARKRLQALGAPKITLMLGTEDDAAARFWLACGYHRDDEVQRFVRKLT